MCQKVAGESTGRFWIPVHMILEGSIDIVVANAYEIKHTSKKKTSWLLYFAKKASLLNSSSAG
jgi:hypothetical protein